MIAATHALDALIQVLERENTALAVFDLAAAAALLPAKQAAAEAVRAAPPGRGDTSMAARLRDLALRNRDLLERAIAVQRQVIALVAAALPRSEGPPRYAQSGVPAHSGQPVAFTLSARA